MHERKRAAHQSKGFTLVEVMLVMAIFSIILMLTVPSFRPTDKRYEGEAFFQQLEDDLFLAQQIALSESTTVVVKFNPVHQFYLVQYISGKVIKRRDIPSSLSFYSNYENHQFHFNQYGNISLAGRLFFHDVKENKPLRTYILQLGNGRFRVERYDQ